MAKIRGRQKNSPKNTGYSEGGASRSSEILRTFQPVKSSPISDIDANLDILRGRASDLSINTPIGSAAVNTSVNYSIGAGLRLYPRIKADILGMTPDEADAWNKKTAIEFDMWASSKLADKRERNSFYDMQEILYKAQLVDGDSFAIINRAYNPNMPYTLRIKMLESSRVSNPHSSMIGSTYGVAVKLSNGNKSVNGVEIDKNGKTVAYWISSRPKYDPHNNEQQITWERVKAKGDIMGMPNVLQICHDERAEQYRGVPYLAPVIEALKQVSRYSTAELTSAIMKTFFSLFFTQSNTSGSIENILGKSTYDDEDENTPCCDTSPYKLGPGTLNALPLGVDVKSVDSSNSQSTFEPFTRELIKQIASAIGQPYEVMMKTFQASYSASRAALLQAWDNFKLRRIWFARDFCQPIYEQWLIEAIAIGRIEAPGFFEDPLIRFAYCNAEWYGPSMSILDPKKETEASILKISYGLSTYEKETAEYGCDFKENVAQLAREQALLKEYGIVPTATLGGGEKKDEGKQDNDQDSDRDDEVLEHRAGGG